ncbi:MAG: hypothetical protein QW836_10135 [Ignisphaera sp.]
MLLRHVSISVSILLVLSIFSLPFNVYADTTTVVSGGGFDLEKWWNSTVNSIKDFFRSVWDGFFGSLKRFTDFIIGIGSIMWNFMARIADFFQFLGNIASFIGEVFGRFGDPPLYYSLYTKMVFTRQFIVDPQLRSAVDSILSGNCSIPLRSLSPYDPSLKNDKRTFCDIIPSGFFGMLSTGYHAAVGSGQLIIWFLRNFVLIHAILFFGTLMLAAASAIRGRSFHPVLEWADWWGRYINLYVRFLGWLIEKIERVAQIIAELLPL